MAGLFEPLPNVKPGIDAFMEGMANSQKIFDSLSQRKLHEAEAKRAEKMASLPFGGANVPGPAGQIVGLEMMKGLYGENSPQYKQAVEAFKLGQTSTQSRVDYQNKLSESMPLRYTTPEGRQIIERSNVNQGYSPSGTPQGQVIAPGQAQYHEPGTGYYQTPGQAPQQQNTVGQEEQAAPMEGATSPQQQQAPNANSEVSNQYNLRQIKSDVPASVLEKNLYATNIEKTIDSIDLNDLTTYNGPIGQFQLKQDEALDAIGKAPERYQKYKEAERKWSFLAGQARQFYGSSIQPEEVKKKEKQLDPRGPFTSASTGKKSFKSASELLKSELKTYRDAAKATDVYHGKNTDQVNPQDAVMNSLPNSSSMNGVPKEKLEGQSPPSGKVWMDDIHGNRWAVLKQNIEAAEKGDEKRPPLKRVE